MNRAWMLVVPCCVFASCRRGAVEQRERSAPVSVHCETPKAMAVDDTVALRGRLQPPPGGDLPVASQVAGRIAQVTVHEGESLHAGDVIAVVDDANTRDAVQQAEAALAQTHAQEENAVVTLERTRALVARGIAARQELDDATAKADEARANVSAAVAAADLARRALGRVAVKSSFAGVVTKVWRGAGALVDGTAATPVVQLAATGAVEFVADATGLDLGRVKEGAVARGTLGAALTFEGVVVARARALDSDHGPRHRAHRRGPPHRASTHGVLRPGLADRRSPRGRTNLARLRSPRCRLGWGGDCRLRRRQGDDPLGQGGLARVGPLRGRRGSGRRTGRGRPRPRPRGRDGRRGGEVRLYALLRRRAAFVWLSALVLVVLGIASALGLPSGIYPEVEFPRIVVVARSGGAPAGVYLSTVTRPLEQALSTVLGVQRIRSRTIRGATSISLQFAPDTDMQRALQMVQGRVGETHASLPSDTEVVVERITTGSFPVLTLNVAGAADPRELRELAEYVVRPALANVPGVGRIEVLGGDVRELEVILKPEVAAGLHLTPSDVASRLRAAMGLRAVGRVERDRQIVTVIGDAQPKTPAEIGDVPIVMAPDGVPIPLGAVAEIVEGHEDRMVRIGGPRGPTVSVSVARLPGASTPRVVEGALGAIAALVPTLPPGVTIDPVYDQASLVHESIASVRDAIVVGIALCAAVIAFFLRDLRAGLFAAAAVPITLAVTFIGMRLAHQTLNLMSLGGMAVAIGLVVDDAIVMVEAIARRRDEGADAATAAAAGAVDLAPAVIGTTLTTVVVFVPLAFLEGVVGDFFRALAFTVTVAVAVSLLVALVLVPLATGLGLSSKPRVDAVDAGAHYHGLVSRLVGHPAAAAAVYVVLLAAGCAAVPFVERGFLPTMDEGAFVLDYFLPAGTSLATTEGFAKKIEAELLKVPEVRSFTRRTGAELGPVQATELNRGDVMVTLVPPGQRRRSADDVIADVRGRLEASLPEVRLEFVQVLQDVLNDLSGNPRPIEVKVLGPDYDRLHEIADSLAERLKPVRGLVDLYGGRERDAPETRFVADRDAMARLGTTADDVSTELETALLGAQVGAIRRFDRLVGVRVRYPDPVRFDADQVFDLPFVARNATTTFRAVSTPTPGASPSQRVHEALEPMVAVTGDHELRDLGAVSDDVRRVVDATALPPGYRVVLGGQIESEQATVRDLSTVAGVAVLLVLTVLAGQFRRLRLAALVIASVPVAMVGALVALVVTATPLNASSLMGCVLLVGLVVKNGVLLLEEAEKLAASGVAAEQAVALASQRRLRPVLMTTVATLAGLVPLALGLGSGAELQRPLAIVVIGGLVTSTFATLGLLPPFAARALRGYGAGPEVGRAVA